MIPLKPNIAVGYRPTLTIIRGIFAIRDKKLRMFCYLSGI